MTALRVVQGKKITLLKDCLFGKWGSVQTVSKDCSYFSMNLYFSLYQTCMLSWVACYGAMCEI